MPERARIREGLSPPTRSTPQFIATTFEKVKLNVRINGKKFEDLKDEYDGTLSQ